MQKGVLYPAAPQRMAYMAQLFPEDALEMYLIIRNPAALLPIFHSVAQDPEDAAFWGGRNPQDLRWSETVASIRSAAPEMPITVCCNEDLPLTWAQLIRDMAGLGPHEKLVGGFDLLHTIMSSEGMQRFRAYLGNQTQISEEQRRRVIVAFLDKFALEDEIEEELDMPGWTEDTVDYLTEIYDQDVEVIKGIPGVTVLAP
ncbi:hypothetical protein [Sulfitobacter aestuariivivens]|uniref:hypothetical protein n=1 Tax=Sulfitobacter aestuariivivens TaxID=2766981 RepID=UPI00361D69CC